MNEPTKHIAPSIWASNFIDEIFYEISDQNPHLTPTEKLKKGIEYANKQCKDLNGKVNIDYINAVKTEIKRTKECCKIIKAKEKINER